MSFERFDDFAQAYVGRALKFAIVLTGNSHDAWDLTQEALVRVAERWERIDGSPEAYATTVLVRLNIDRLRRLRRELVTSTLPERAVEAAYDATTLSQWLIDGLQDLTPRQRTALALRCIYDLDVASIAEEMNCSTGTVKSHLSRGFERMRLHAANTSDTHIPDHRSPDIGAAP